MKSSQSRGIIFTWIWAKVYKFQRSKIWVTLTLANSQNKSTLEVYCPSEVPKRTYFITVSRGCRSHKVSGKEIPRSRGQLFTWHLRSTNYHGELASFIKETERRQYLILKEQWFYFGSPVSSTATNQRSKKVWLHLRRKGNNNGSWENWAANLKQTSSAFFVCF